MKIYWNIIYHVFNLQTVFRLKTCEDDMLSTRVIKLSIITIQKEIVVIIFSNITCYSKVDARCQSYSGN